MFLIILINWLVFIEYMLVTNLLTILNQLRIYHWQTRGKGSFAQHKALDKAYGEFSDLIDSFVEVFMGKYGRIKSKDGFTITLVNYENQNSPTEFCDKYVEYLTVTLPKELNVESDTDLLNIRDEMLAQLNKLKYLLTLE